MTAALPALRPREALRGGRPPGVYRLASRTPAACFQQAATRAGRHCFVLEADGITEKVAFLAAAAAAMRFPAYAARNWDAFEECVNDLSWAPAEAYLLLIEGGLKLRARAPAVIETAMAILRDAAAPSPAGRAAPLWTLLR